MAEGTRAGPFGPDGQLDLAQEPPRYRRQGSSGASGVVDEQAPDVPAVQHVPVTLVDLVE